MSHLPPLRRQDGFPRDRNSDLSRPRGGLITVPRKSLMSIAPLKGNNASSRTLTKLLHNVNIQGSFGPVHVLISLENTVGDLIKAAIDVYLKEKRRPLLTATDDSCFELHYSQFSLESLKTEEKLINLGSRNFFMCPNPKTTTMSTSNSSCTANSPFPLTNFMDFLL